MPHAHNGYLDTRLEMGYIGFALLVIFIFATLHAARRLVDRDPARAWLVLSLALYNILTNFLESTWLRGGDPLWVVFVCLVAEIGRYSQPFSSPFSTCSGRQPVSGWSGVCRVRSFTRRP